MNARLSNEELIQRNLMLLRAKHSDSEEECQSTTPVSVPELLPEDMTFLKGLTRDSFKAEANLARLTSLIHSKLELISRTTDAQMALETGLKTFTKAYWPCLMSDQRLANPINDVFKAVLYYCDRKDLAWIAALCEKLDFHRRMRLVGFELDAISEQHQIEIDMRRTDEKRAKQRKKEEEKRMKRMGEPMQELPESPVKRPVEIPKVEMEMVFGEEFSFEENEGKPEKYKSQ